MEEEEEEKEEMKEVRGEIGVGGEIGAVQWGDALKLVVVGGGGSRTTNGGVSNRIPIQTPPKSADFPPKFPSKPPKRDDGSIAP